MTPIRCRSGDFPELFWDADPNLLLEIVCSEHRRGAPAHIRIGWRSIAEVPELSGQGRSDGKAG